jgi:predicted AAA+ superfamily ATPase
MKSYRHDFYDEISRGFRNHPIVGLLGPRQVGKTTLAKMYANEVKEAGESAYYFDLEDALVSEQFLTNPKAVLQDLSGLIILDEIQRIPELFPVLRVLVDSPHVKQQFLILGSASPMLIRQSSETLAGRIRYIELTPFNYAEIHDLQKLWVRGGFPKSYLAETFDDSEDWRNAYIRTFLEQDIPNLGFQIPAQNIRRFWMMLAHYHGQIFNSSEIARNLGISDKTVRSYLDILSGTFMVRQLPPWLENIKKRQVKTPKIYFRDSGLFHTLLNIGDHEQLLVNPKLGASWEGFILEEIIRAHQAEPEKCFFWAVHEQGEIDLIIHTKGKKLGFEIKFADAPKMTKFQQAAIETLSLDSLNVIYPGKQSFHLNERISIMGAEEYLKSARATQ